MKEEWFKVTIQKISEILFDPIILNSIAIFGTLIGVSNFSGKIIYRDGNAKKKKKSKYNQFETITTIIISVCFFFFVAASYHYKNQAEEAIPTNNVYYEVFPGWGPERNTYRIETPSHYPSINSFVNNPSNGDERNFTRIKKTGSDAYFIDDIVIEKDTYYTVYVYFSNSSTANQDLLETRMNVILPSCIPQRGTNGIAAKISSSTSIPNTVWDACCLINNSSSTLEVQYVDESAAIYTAGKLDGSLLNSEEFLTSGTLLGINHFDGVIKGEAHPRNTSGYVLFEVYVTEPKTMFMSWKTTDSYLGNMSHPDVKTVVFRYINTNCTPDEVTLSILNIKNANVQIESVSYCNEHTGYERRQLNHTKENIALGKYLPGEICYLFFDYFPVIENRKIDVKNNFKIYIKTSNATENFEVALD